MLLLPAAATPNELAGLILTFSGGNWQLAPDDPSSDCFLMYFISMSEGFGLKTCRRKLKVMSGTSSKKGRTMRMKMGYRRWLGQLDNTLKLSKTWKNIPKS